MKYKLLSIFLFLILFFIQGQAKTKTYVIYKFKSAYLLKTLKELVKPKTIDCQNNRFTYGEVQIRKMEENWIYINFYLFKNSSRIFDNNAWGLAYIDSMPIFLLGEKSTYTATSHKKQIKHSENLIIVDPLVLRVYIHGKDVYYLWE